MLVSTGWACVHGVDGSWRVRVEIVRLLGNRENEPHCGCLGDALAKPVQYRLRLLNDLAVHSNRAMVYDAEIDSCPREGTALVCRNENDTLKPCLG